MTEEEVMAFMSDPKPPAVMAVILEQIASLQHLVEKLKAEVEFLGNEARKNRGQILELTHTLATLAPSRAQSGVGVASYDTMNNYLTTTNSVFDNVLAAKPYLQVQQEVEKKLQDMHRSKELKMDELLRERIRLNIFKKEWSFKDVQP